MNWKSPDIRRLIADALREDHARHDITTRTLIPAHWRLDAAIKAKEPGVVAGLPLAVRFFEAMDRRCWIILKAKDGQVMRPGQTIFLIKGPARSILAAERPALNTLQHLSGIATFTHELVQKLKGTKTKLLDTRKTLPGWRALQKYAVACGGGHNHRMSLGDAILVKENHLKILRMGGRSFPFTTPGKEVILEIQTAQDLRLALKVTPDIVLLDNLSLTKLKSMIRTLRRELPKTQIEISGGVKPDDLKTLARLGVERISMGKLTHSAPAWDCSLDILRVHTS